jgi:hypothetical protein
MIVDGEPFDDDSVGSKVNSNLFDESIIVDPLPKLDVNSTDLAGDGRII